ncbi:hypothetical protein [Methanobrevibacter sp.]|uniref:hypothetical protein n=1 Tax=Methanobrevibacter sp. TaxID=66852 RepID=UPI00388F25E0
MDIQNASFSNVSKTNYLTRESFDVTLLDENGTGLANKSVYFVINKTTSEVSTDENGTAKFSLNNMTKGTYTIKYIFNETGYNPIKGSKKILVLTKTTSTIKGSDIKIYAGIKHAFKVTLKADGMALSGRIVTFKVNKKTYNVKTNSNGQASITLYLSKGKYTVKYSYGGEENIKSSSSKATVNVVYHKNPYKTKYRHVYIDADGGFSKSFLNAVAKKLRKAGWKVTVYGIGPGQHSINYKKVKGGVYMPFYNGLCAGTIKEMAASYYGGVIKSKGSVLAPSWYTKEWTSETMKQYRTDISKIKYLKRAWDDNFSPKSFKGIKNPAKFMTDNKVKYTVADTIDKIVDQFLHGGWDAYSKL